MARRKRKATEGAADSSSAQEGGDRSRRDDPAEAEVEMRRSEAMGAGPSTDAEPAGETADDLLTAGLKPAQRAPERRDVEDATIPDEAEEAVGAVEEAANASRGQGFESVVEVAEAFAPPEIAGVDRASSRLDPETTRDSLSDGSAGGQDGVGNPSTDQLLDGASEYLPGSVGGMHGMAGGEPVGNPSAEGGAPGGRVPRIGGDPTVTEGTEQPTPEDEASKAADDLADTAIRQLLGDPSADPAEAGQRIVDNLPGDSLGDAITRTTIAQQTGATPRPEDEEMIQGYIDRTSPHGTYDGPDRGGPDRGVPGLVETVRGEPGVSFPVEEVGQPIDGEDMEDRSIQDLGSARPAQVAPVDPTVGQWAEEGASPFDPGLGFDQVDAPLGPDSGVVDPEESLLGDEPGPDGGVDEGVWN